MSRPADPKRRPVVLALVVLLVLVALPNTAHAQQQGATSAEPAATAGAGQALTNADVLKLVKSGLADETILLLIKQQPTQFDTSPDALVQLKKEGLSDQLLSAMIAATPFRLAKPAPSPDGSLAASTSGPSVEGHPKTPIPAGITLCVAPMPGNFDGYIVGEMSKQEVPVTIVASDPVKGCDPAKSFYTMTGNVEPEGKSFSARSIFGLRLHSRDEIQGAVKLVRNSDSLIVWAGDSDRGEVTKVAEHIVNQMLKQRPMWIPSPINR
jgi:hypothetical protein